MNALDERLRIDLYHRMVRLRAVELAVARHYSEWEMRCPVHLCVGQEAACIGPTAALRPQDWVFSGHRAHGHYLGKGGSLQGMMDEMYGKATGCASGLGGSMHLLDLDAGFLGATPIVGSTIPIAVGAALGARLRGEARAVMAFFGDGATEAGVFHESLNFAQLKQLPVLFVCENNQFSVYSPLPVRRPPDLPLTRLAASHGLPTVLVDGNDVEACFQATRAALEHCLAGHGPYFLELTTWRWLEHCGPNTDDTLGYRTVEAAEAWKESDPIARYGQTLQNDGILTSAQRLALTQEAEAEAEHAIAGAKAAPWPDPSLITALGTYMRPYSASKEDPSCAC